jgi:ADP-heptose:LPS heptosyltransferase
MISPRKFVSRALLVRPGALGDTILSLPLLESIRLRQPGARIVFLGTRPYGALMPPWVDFQPLDHPRWLWLFAGEGASIGPAGCSFDVAYVVLNKPEHVIRNLRKAGVESIVHTSSRPGPGEHVVERLHRGLGLAVPSRIPALAAPLIRRNKLVWLHPGSGGPGKCVPLGFLLRFADAVGKALGGWPRVVTVGAEDEFLVSATEWQTMINAPGTRLLKQRPLAELRGELGSAGLFIGNDSGISHLAGALGVPGIVFFVSTDPSQWGPWVAQNQIRLIDLRGERLDSYAVGPLVSQACALARDYGLSGNG